MPQQGVGSHIPGSPVTEGAGGWEGQESFEPQQQNNGTRGLLTRQTPCGPALCYQLGKAPQRPGSAQGQETQDPQTTAARSGSFKGRGSWSQPHPSPSQLHLPNSLPYLAWRRNP